MRTRTFCRFVGHTALASVLLAAQPTFAQDPTTTVDELTITAQKPLTKEEKIDRFVEETSVKSPTGQLGRWDKEICVGFENFMPDKADVIRNSISTAARDASLSVGQPGCAVNLLIIGTTDATAYLKESVKQNKKYFLDDDFTIRVGAGKLKEFVNSDAPVRWWFVTKRVTRDGKPYRVGSGIEGRGRIGSTVRADFSHAIVVLDTSRIPNIRALDFKTLADYIAMVSLVQTDPDANFPNVPSILRLFNDRNEGLTPVEGLSDWDRGFITALYKAPRDAKRDSIQKFDMRQTLKVSLKTP